MNEKQHYIYLYNMSKSIFQGYLSKNSKTVHQHWDYLRKLKQEKTLLFAGSTLDSTYEIVIIQVKNKEDAKAIYEKDPFTVSNLLEGQLCSFRTTMLSEDKVEESLKTTDLNLHSMYEGDSSFYLGTLTGRPTLVNDMTEEEEKIMGAHFQYLKKNFDEKKVILSGPILEEGMFGISVSYASNSEEAYRFVKNDPAVINKVLEPNIHPFRVFLIGKKDN